MFPSICRISNFKLTNTHSAVTQSSIRTQTVTASQQARGNGLAGTAPVVIVPNGSTCNLNYTPWRFVFEVEYPPSSTLETFL